MSKIVTVWCKCYKYNKQNDNRVTGVGEPTLDRQISVNVPFNNPLFTQITNMSESH